LAGEFGEAGELLIRAKCAPFFRRILYALDPVSPLLSNFAEGSCPAGQHYCRIMPNGDVTACPYMPVVAGNLRRTPFADLWREADIFLDLRGGRLGGRCGPCEFSRICGGCRCRAYATFGDYLAEDPACAYRPGTSGGRVIELPAHQTFGMRAEASLTWTAEAQARLQQVPGFARGMVIKGMERYARERGVAIITPELMLEVRQRMAGRFALFARK
jgi:radical SAM protein with 4Fe4S-binding SPASM domain